MTDYSHIDATACRKLWASALTGELRAATRPTPSEDRDATRQWLLTRSGYMAELAGLDGDIWLEQMARLDREGWKLHAHRKDPTSFV